MKSPVPVPELVTDAGPIADQSTFESIDQHQTASPIIACISMVLLAVGLVGAILSNVGLRGAGLILFTIVGIGTAPLLWGRPRRGFEILGLGLPLGLAATFIVGSALVYAHLWSLGLVVYVLLATLAAATDIRVLLIARSEPLVLPTKRRSRRGHLPDPAPESRTGTIQLIAVLVGGAACIVSAFLIQNLDPGQSGFLGAISPAWYIGLLVIVALIVVGIRNSNLALVATGVITLQVVLTTTPAIIYTDPRYSWTEKHVGVTAYFLAHGKIAHSPDIYQSWPGLFAGVAWLCHVAGVHNPIDVARWWTPAVDVASLLVFRQLAGRVLVDSLRCWIATLLFVLGNTIGQDYYSPQSAAYLLAIAVFAIVFRRKDEPRGMPRDDWIYFLAFSIAMAITHQISPYMVTGALVVLTVFGFVKSRWVAVATFVPGALWASLHVSIIRKYFSFGQVGDLTANLQTTGVKHQGVHRHLLILLNVVALTINALVIGFLALYSLIANRSKFHLTLAVCALSAAGLIVAQSYGNEGDFRVLLFALPWLALLAADQWKPGRLLFTIWTAAFVVLLVSSVVANFDLDYINVVRPGDLSAAQTFERTAAPGATLFVLGSGYVPVRSTAQYANFKYFDYTGEGSQVFPSSTATAQEGYQTFMVYLDSIREALQNRKHEYYVLAGKQPSTDEIELGLTTPTRYQELTNAFLTSNRWTLVVHTSTAYLFKLKST
jgi:hypothetical protein